VHCRWYVTAIADSNGELESILNIGQDITQQVETSKRLNEAKIKAEKLTEAKSNFIASVSHELRTPMHGILNAADLLSEETLNANASELVKLIHDSSESLLHVIDDVLDFSRLEVGKLNLNQQAVDNNAIIKSVIQLLHGNAEKRGNQLDFQSSCEQLFIEADAGRLRQILYNLIGNAVKFTKNGNIHVELTDELHSDKSQTIHIAVSDNGIGIAQDRHEEIFDSFAQADESINSRFGGSGLGLAISQRFAELLGGSISVASELGQGATFTLSFTATQRLANETPTTNTTLSRKYQGHVLVVDDNPVNISISTKLLEKLGLSVSTATNGQQAVEQVQQQQYDCVLMDIQMPVMDGLTAAMAIRKLGKHCKSLPIIAMSANSVGDNLDYYQSRGIDNFIIKPFKQSALITLLDQYLKIEA
jgi:signal transduction histidine kinase/BarA-like signal transduction histidine kinase